MVVVVLLGVIWAAVLVPPALRVHAARRQAFLVSFETTPAPDFPDPRRLHLSRVQRRRRILGGLLTASLATGLVGLLPTFRVLLTVHLFLVNSFLGYACLLASTANRARRAAGPAAAVRRSRLPSLPRPAMPGDLPPIAPLG